MSNNGFEKWLEETKSQFEAAYSREILSALPTFKSKLNPAIQYVTQNTGKMIRPMLCFASARAFNIPLAQAMPYAIAVEAIHTYSLIHDDLPSMDNDNLRRGQPTCHIQFDEATAILVGDALQSMAFQFILESSLDDAIKIKLALELAKAIGPKGMVGGQMLDMEAANSNQINISTNASLLLNQLDHLHSLKTGSLITAAINAGALLNQEYTAQLHDNLSTFGNLIGLAFQIQDDILDVTASTEVLGKPAKSDENSKKLTYPAVIGLTASKIRLDTIYKQALDILTLISGDTQYLQSITGLIVTRIN